MNLPEAVFGLGCGIVAVAFAVLLKSQSDEPRVIFWAIIGTALGMSIAVIAFAHMQG